MGSRSVQAKRCQGCGRKLPAGKRKWCGDVCRTGTLYGGRCEVCGRVTSGKNGRALAPRFCAKHSPGPQSTSEKYAQEFRERREWLASMVRERHSNQEIAEILNTTTGCVGSMVHRLRRYGYELPYRNRESHSAHPWRHPLD